MDSLSLSELKRLTRPYSSERDEADALRYWAERTPQERVQPNERLMREFCRWRGIDIDKPMDKTPRRITWEEKNRDHEVWHGAFEQFLRER
jgi:hypothetical protein